MKNQDAKSFSNTDDDLQVMFPVSAAVHCKSGCVSVSPDLMRRC